MHGDLGELGHSHSFWTRFRFAIYGTFAIPFITGAGWLVADHMKDAAGGEGWQMAAAYMLMLHGAALMPRSEDERHRVGHLI